jgi:flagellar basal-body rod protein FlgG
VRVAASTRNFSQGTLQQSGNPLDIAINGQGFFQVTLPDGSTGYTRDGSFQKDANGQIVTSSGYVLQPGITVPKEATSVDIASDGTVSVSIVNQVAPQKLGQIQLASFINPSGLDPRGGNMYSETAASGPAQAGAPNTAGHGGLLQSFTEGSNVNVVQELVSMIATQRAYELNSKAIQASDQMLQKLGQL